VRVVWSDEALADLTGIHDYIAQHSPHYAALTVERLLDALDRVADYPESGRMVPELAEPAVREVIHGAYRLVYELREGRAEVLTVFRASRLFPRQLRRAE
jgi:plasmid stabilization system protein ParE